FVWHPDGRSLVYVSRGETVEDEKKDTGRRITRMRYRFDGEGFLPTAPADLYAIGLDGEPNRLTDTPQEQAFGAPSGLAFSPDGQTLYFCRAADERSYDDFLSDVLALDLGNQQVSVVLSAVRGVGGLAVSPSGRTLSFTAASDQDDAASPTGVWLLDLVASAADKVPRLLTGDDDASPAEA